MAAIANLKNVDLFSQFWSEANAAITNGSSVEKQSGLTIHICVCDKK